MNDTITTGDEFDVVIIHLLQMIYVGNRPQWESYPATAGYVARANGITTAEAVEYFDNRTPQAGREALREHRESIEQGRSRDPWVARAALTRAEYKRYLTELEKSSGS